MREYAWAIPTEVALQALLELAPLVELGAGGGYWTMLLRERGADVLAYDLEPHRNAWVERGWSVVDVGSPAVLDTTSRRRTLVVMWPAHETGLAGQALACYSGEAFAYAGELGGTPDLLFDEILELEWKLERTIELPHWPGFEDDLTIWRRGRISEPEGSPSALRKDGRAAERRT